MAQPIAINIKFGCASDKQHNYILENIRLFNSRWTNDLIIGFDKCVQTRMVKWRSKWNTGRYAFKFVRTHSCPFSSVWMHSHIRQHANCRINVVESMHTHNAESNACPLPQSIIPAKLNEALNDVHLSNMFDLQIDAMCSTDVNWSGLMWSIEKLNLLRNFLLVKNIYSHQCHKYTFIAGNVVQHSHEHWP